MIKLKYFTTLNELIDVAINDQYLQISQKFPDILLLLTEELIK